MMTDFRSPLALGRVALGTVLLVAPGRVHALATGSREVLPQVVGPLRMAGARDLAIGVGALTGEDPRRWLLAGAFADAVDAAALACDRSLRPRLRPLLSAGAAAAALLGWSIARRG